MLIKTILNHIHPIKGFVYTKVKMRTLPREEIIVAIEPRKGSKALCSICEKRCPGYDRLPERFFAFIPLWNIPFSFKYRPRRVKCKVHGVVVEQFSWARGKEHSTIAFQVFLAQWANLLSWTTVAKRFKTTWDTVYDAIKRVVDYGIKNRDVSGVKSIGVDEIAVGKGHDYVTLVYQIDADVRRLLWIGKDRTTKTFLNFFQEFGKEWADGIEYVCSDMWKPYLNVIAKKIPKALNILDRFHIMKKFNDGIDEVRRQEVAVLKRDGYEPVLTKTRWLILKKPENLTLIQKGSLRKLLKYNLQSVRAYLLREEFQQFWTYTSECWAGKFLDEWVRKTNLSKIEPMKKVAKMLCKHKALIMNWFKAQGTLSSGVVEAMNNNAKVTMRKSYGFREYETLKYALYHKLGGLPIPDGAHKFF